LSLSFWQAIQKRERLRGLAAKSCVNYPFKTRDGSTI